jgi:chemotaxis protein MotB
MKSSIQIFITAACLSVLMFTTSCVSKKQFAAMKTQFESDLKLANDQLGKCGKDLNESLAKISACEQEKTALRNELKTGQNTLKLREEQIQDLKNQIADCKSLRDKQLTQVGDLTVLSQSANQNVKETLQQLEKKDKYIQLLQAAKTKADSINLALAVNLKGVLADGVTDKDVEVKVDKTVVFINLSDKMLYQSGSANITPKAQEVLGKIAKIVDSRPDLEVMVEGYTDNVAIKTNCIDDNWDLSVKRATSVVRVLQKNYGIDPKRLIAAGRGEFSTLASNDTPEGRATNRRTRIIILPKLDQFYDLLNPNNAPK